jgi:hypothetical protein
MTDFFLTLSIFLFLFTATFRRLDSISVLRLKAYLESIDKSSLFSGDCVRVGFLPEDGHTVHSLKRRFKLKGLLIKSKS